MEKAALENLVSLIGWFGLALDFVGAIFLARSVLRTTIKNIIESTELYPGGNHGLRVSMLEQNVEAVIGIPCIAVGFLAQFVSSLLSNLEAWRLAVAVICGGLLIYVLLLLLSKNMLRKRTMQMILNTNLRNHDQQNTENPEWQNKIIIQAALGGFKRKKDEPFACFLSRLKEAPFIRENRPSNPNALL